MSALTNNKINSLARILRNEGNVDFKHAGDFYEVFKSANGGYIINIYSSDDKEDDVYIDSNLIDGGLCDTDSAIDAIKFMF